MQILGDQSAPGTLELELPESKLDRRLIRCSARGRKRSATTTSSGAGTVRREKFENPMMMMREREREGETPREQKTMTSGSKSDLSSLFLLKRKR